MTVAVLFARADSHYKTMDGVEVYDMERDARTYDGPHPVVAHPPCRAWGRLRTFANPRPDERNLARLAVAMVREFVAAHHRHNKPPVGWKFGLGLQLGDALIGVATAGRPVARHYDDGTTLEVNRTCTDGTPNANSMLYGAVWRAAKAMGYKRCITYTQADETGASLRAAGWVKVKTLEARKSWAESSVALKDKRDPVGNGGVPRVLWECRIHGA